MMFDLHAVIRSCRVLFSISNAFMKLGSSQLSSFSAFTVKKNASKILINDLTTQPYADSTSNDKFSSETMNVLLSFLLLSLCRCASNWWALPNSSYAQVTLKRNVPVFDANIFYILITCLLDNVTVLWGEMRIWSLTSVAPSLIVVKQSILGSRIFIF